MRFRKPKDFTRFQHGFIYKFNFYFIGWVLTKAVLGALFFIAFLPAFILYLPLTGLFRAEQWFLDNDRIRYFYMEHDKK